MKRLFAGCLLSLSVLFVQAQTGDSLDIMIGQMIMIGIGDFNIPDRTEPIYYALEQGYAGGIILFEKNISNSNPRQNLKTIIADAQDKSPIPLFVSVDEEGGRVTRLKTKYGFPKTVTAQYLGRVDNLDSTQYYVRQTASTLKALGFNLNYAPSVDVNINPQNPIIGRIGRSYSSDYLGVVKHAGEVVKIHKEYGVATALKHFPGHGSSKSDTHLGVADVTDTWNIEEIYPYKMLIDSGNVTMIMTAHIVNGIIDEQKLPGTLSYKVVTELLRNILGYNGVVISDDMQMGAIRKEFGIGKALELSINAGVDIVMFANNVPGSEMVSAGEIHKIIKAKVTNNQISVSRIQESYQRIMNLKRDLGLLPESEN
ncbi:glycoside hydrolase family 3 protein [Marinoscillum sp. MHG1-6]|uniref:glycoside hydrolase family 3 protein n=1 Tax=Marinoscillum sp. MHG1-6 TaxID=2959627 RepID=UPI002157B529|nr:glycoside hydrolase family 3 N-terminal domain-containing protein [Marinoscillum sp. MHG1-6]